MEKEPEKKRKKVNTLVTILIILLIVAVGYIAYDKVKTAKETELNKAIQAGAQYGYEQAVVEIAKLAVTCQQVPLRIGNDTLNVVAVNCLQQTPASSGTK